jgi:hypothetical protein
MIRHGERIDHAVRGWQGTPTNPRTDPPLSRFHGLMQAVETGLNYRRLRLKATPLHGGQTPSSPHYVIRTSPFLRCWQTAAIILLVGFDNQATFLVDDALGDWRHAKMYPKGDPMLCARRIHHNNCDSNNSDSSITFDDPQLTKGTILEALRLLEDSQELLRRHNIKPTVIARWRQLVVDEHPPNQVTTTPVVQSAPLSSYPESMSAFEERCQRSLASLTKGQEEARRETTMVELRITHADVIQQVLTSFLPRVGHKFSGGRSVPYCSVTRIAPPAVATASKGRHGDGRMASAEWKLPHGCEVGATTHLRTSSVVVSFT